MICKSPLTYSISGNMVQIWMQINFSQMNQSCCIFFRILINISQESQLVLNNRRCICFIVIMCKSTLLNRSAFGKVLYIQFHLKEKDQTHSPEKEIFKKVFVGCRFMLCLILGNKNLIDC